MQVRLAALADWAATTEHGKLVIAGVMDTVVVSRLPATHPMMALAVRLVADPGEGRSHSITLRLVDPDGVEVLPALNGNIEFGESDPIEGARAQVVLNMPGVTFKSAGAHRMDVLVDGRLESSVDLFVRLAPEKQE
ncbi:hypothetical protein EG835_08570 [bacterium]|nr:hypothetical protein [bacterium]